MTAPSRAPNPTIVQPHNQAHTMPSGAHLHKSPAQMLSALETRHAVIGIRHGEATRGMLPHPRVGAIGGDDEPFVFTTNRRVFMHEVLLQRLEPSRSAKDPHPKLK